MITLKRTLSKSYPFFLTIGILVCCISSLGTSVLAQSPQFNFSDLGSNPNMGLSKLLSAFKKISGTYTNPDFGFTIVFPSGWEGSQISFGSSHIASVRSPGGLENNTRSSAIGVMFVDNRKGEAIAALSNASQMIVDSSASDTEDSSQKPECKSTSVSQVKINGINGEERTFSCTNSTILGENSNIKVYALVTKDDSLLTISFISPQGTYDKDLPTFEQAVKTISLANPGDISNSASYNVYRNALDKEMK